MSDSDSSGEHLTQMRPSSPPDMMADAAGLKAAKAGEDDSPTAGAKPIFISDYGNVMFGPGNPYVLNAVESAEAGKLIADLVCYKELKQVHKKLPTFGGNHKSTMVSKMGDNEHYINEMFVNMIDLLAEKLDFRSSTVGKVLGSKAHPPTPVRCAVEHVKLHIQGAALKVDVLNNESNHLPKLLWERINKDLGDKAEPFLEVPFVMTKAASRTRACLDWEGKNVNLMRIQQILSNQHVLPEDLQKMTSPKANLETPLGDSQLASYMQSAVFEAANRIRTQHQQKSGAANDQMLQAATLRRLETGSSVASSTVSALSVSTAASALGKRASVTVSEAEDGIEDAWEAADRTRMAELQKQKEKNDEEMRQLQRKNTAGPEEEGEATVESYYGASLEQVMTNPAKYAKRWTTPRPDANGVTTPPQIVFVPPKASSGHVWATVTNVTITGNAMRARDLTILFTITPCVSHIPPFQMPPASVAGGFLAARICRAGLGDNTNSGGVSSEALVGQLINQLKATASGGASDGSDAPGQGRDPNVSWTKDHMIALQGAERRAGAAQGSLLSAMEFSAGNEAILFGEWARTKVSWKVVENKTPQLARRLREACARYNRVWRVGWKPLPLLHLITMNWTMISDDAFVDTLVRRDNIAVPADTAPEAYVLHTADGAPTFEQRAKSVQSKGGFKTVEIFLSAFTHAKQILNDCKGMAFTEQLMGTLRLGFDLLMVSTNKKLGPVKQMWKLVTTDIRDKYVDYVNTIQAVAPNPPDGGFMLYNAGEMSAHRITIVAEWQQLRVDHLTEMQERHYGGSGSNGGAGGGGNNNSNNSDNDSSGGRKKKRRERREADRKRRATERKGNARSDNDEDTPPKQKKEERPKKKKKASEVDDGRPFWIKAVDWSVVTDYGVNHYAEAVEKWRGTCSEDEGKKCFWQAHDRSCCNKFCPACHPRE